MLLMAVKVVNAIDDMIVEVIREHLVKSGLLKRDQMNEYFESIIRCLSKIADTERPDYRGLAIRKEEALNIVQDVQMQYNKYLWNALYEGIYPENKYGETSRPVLIKFKDIVIPEVCLYDFLKKKFISTDGRTEKYPVEWCEIPGYGYAS